MGVIFFLMTRAIFLFISSLLLLLPFVGSEGAISISSQMILCVPLLLFLGIPHGAIDNVLYLRKHKTKNALFIGVYVFIVGLNILIWVLSPSIAYVLFLVLSAYHFGQSQFSQYFKNQLIDHKALYFFWGLAVLFGFVLFNLEEINGIMIQYEEFAVFSPLHQKIGMQIGFASTLAVAIGFKLKLTLQKTMTIENFLMELLVLGLILVCFYLMPLLIGFTLYFVILHSFKVLREEYQFLNVEREVSSVKSFIFLLAPFTLLSIIGIAFMFGLIHFDILSISYGYCLIIIISSITLPHVFVMNRFYDLLSYRKAA